MAQIRVLPDQNGRIVQTGFSETTGNVASTWNVDFKSNPGRIKPSKRLLPFATSSTLANMGLPIVFNLFPNNTLWTIAGGYAFNNNGSFTGAITQNADTGAGDFFNSSYSDSVVFASKMITSTRTGLTQRNTNTWEQTAGSMIDIWASASYLNQSTALQDSYPHPLIVNSANLLTIGDGNKVHTVTTALNSGGTTNTRLSVAADQTIMFFLRSSTRTWICCMSNNYGEGLVYEWDGASTLPLRSYRIGATGAFSGVIKDDIPYIVTSDGCLKGFNGSGFKTIAQLPVKRTDDVLAGHFTTNRELYHHFIHPRGMSIYKGDIAMNISNQVVDGNSVYRIDPDTPAGVWIYSEDNGLYHYSSPSLSATADFGQFAATTPSTSSGTGGKLGVTAGALYYNEGQVPSLFAGYSIYGGDETGRIYGVFTDDWQDTADKRARVITSWLYGPQLTNAWNKIGLIYRRFANSDDRIIVKYRPRKKDTFPFQASVIWTNNTTFTSTNTAFNNVSVGDEVFVIMGDGSGASAHVSSITVNTPSWTVVLDEAIPGVSAADTGKVQVDNWKKITTISDQFSDHEERQIPDQGHSPRMQFLIEMRSGGGKTPELERFLVELKEQI